jgi:hypothetical protein
MKKSRKFVLFGLAGIIVLAGVAFSIPRIRTSLTFRLSQTFTNVMYVLFPPEKSVFTPNQGGADSVATAVQATINAYTSPTQTPSQVTPLPSATPTNTPMPLPSTVFLKGVRAEEQRYNNCGPTTLSMYLSFYGWVGHLNPNAEVPQDHIAPYVKPNPEDKNVMPYELQTYVQENTDYDAIIRMGGDLQTLKALTAAGFPVMVEKGFDVPSSALHPVMGWMGHYDLVVGYDEQKQVFHTKDSYLPLILNSAEAAKLNFTYNASLLSYDIPYDDFYDHWRAFNYVFMVVFPKDKTNDVLNQLGALMDENNAYRVAYDRAIQESKTFSDPRDQFFAWFNAGTSLVYLHDYSGAAQAYDTAYGIYPSIPEGDRRPWRMTWYQTGPYFAYYYTKRYEDVIQMATTTLDAMQSKKAIEESWYWRAMAELATGDQAAAVQDFRESLVWHPGFTPSVDQLNALGLTP